MCSFYHVFLFPCVCPPSTHLSLHFSVNMQYGPAAPAPIEPIDSWSQLPAADAPSRTATSPGDPGDNAPAERFRSGGADDFRGATPRNSEDGSSVATPRRSGGPSPRASSSGSTRRAPEELVNGTEAGLHDVGPLSLEDDDASKSAGGCQHGPPPDHAQAGRCRRPCVIAHLPSSAVPLGRWNRPTSLRVQR